MTSSLPPLDDAGRTPVPGALASALPDALLALGCLCTWVAPQAMPAGTAGGVLLLVLLEFIVVHSSAFMGMQLVTPGPAGRRVLTVLGFGLFYSLFVGAFSLAFHAWWPLVSFWLLTLNRLTPILLGRAPAGGEREHLQRTWAGNAICYIAAVFVTLVLPLPALGMTPERVAALHLPGRGIWVSQPWRVTAAAALYYGLVAWLEATDYRAIRTAPPASAPR